MEYNFLTNIENCYVDIPSLLYYSHIPTAVVVLIFGIFLLLKNKENLVLSRILFSISFVFAVWSSLDIILWRTYSSITMTSLWSLFGVLYTSIYLLSLYFIYVYVDQKDISGKLKLFLLGLFLPILTATPTSLNLTGFDLENCQPTENLYFNIYQYSLGIFIIIWILHLLYSRFVVASPERKKPILFIGTGILLFLLSFSWSEIVGSFSENFEITQYGLFGAPVFIGFLTYSIVKFKTFNIKLLAAQALIWGVSLLIGAQFFFIRTPINRVLNGITFFASVTFGYFLIKSVKREVEQREHIEKLNVSLRDLIKQRESLVHLITHKVKGSFTRTKFIFVGLLDGTFGDINPEVKKVAQQGLDFDNGGIQTVDLVLNVANLQNGLIKYDMKKIDFKDVVEKTSDEKKMGAEAKGLKIEKDIKDGSYNTTGDAFWLKEVVNNMIENSIKYTPSGVITVGLENKDGKALFSVKDTGLGITEEDKANLFTEGGRGKDSIKVNVDSTGYGLFTVKMVVEAHKGKVWAESEGAGKGSQFYVELPLV